MRTEFTFPLALCKAQYGTWLHALEWFETAGSRVMQDGIALTRAQADVVMRAEDWHALSMAPMRALRHSDADDVSHAAPAVTAAPSRRVAVNDALRTLHAALAPSARRLHAGRKVAATRGSA